MSTLRIQAETLANYLPSGEAFAAKKIDGSVTRLLLEGLAGELLRSSDLLEEFRTEILPDETILFLDEWEAALGIPDGCFTGSGTDDERRRDVLAKLASFGVQTAADFEALALIFGLVVDITGGGLHGAFPFKFPMIFFPSAKTARFTIVVNFTSETAATFTYTFPIPFSTPELVLLECLFNVLKPANCEVFFTSFPLGP